MSWLPLPSEHHAGGFYWSDKERKWDPAAHPGLEMTPRHLKLGSDPSPPPPLSSHLNDHSVFAMFGFIGEVRLLRARVPDQHLENRIRVRECAGSRKAASK